MMKFRFGNDEVDYFELARVFVFRRWPSSTSAARLHKAAGKAWPDFRDEAVATLALSVSLG